MMRFFDNIWHLLFSYMLQCLYYICGIHLYYTVFSIVNKINKRQKMYRWGWGILFELYHLYYIKPFNHDKYVIKINIPSMVEDLSKALESLDLKKSSVEKGRFGESYVIDKSTGNKYILPTKRADGSLRKEIKVRPGYLPLEERQVYIPVHRRTANQSNSKKTTVSNDLDKNRPEDSNKLGENVKSVSTEPKPGKPDSTKKHFKDKFGKYKPKSNLDSKKSDVVKCDSNSSSSEANDSSNLDTSNKNENDVYTETSKKLGENDDELTDAKFRNSLHNTLKKIREVKLLQEKLKKGLVLDANQQKKINRLPELEQKLKELKSMDQWDLKVKIYKFAHRDLRT